MDINSDCIFCKIANKEASANILHEGDDFLIFQDIMPKAPVHAQIIPKRHIPTMNELGEEDSAMIAKMILAARDYAIQSGVSETGYKIVINNGKQGGQIIPHLHMHLLGGKQLEE